MGEAELKAALIAAGEDETAAALRRQLCASLAGSLREAGKLLWVGGVLIGADRADGSSPRGFGSDATVGLGTAIQIAGELVSGASLLLADGNRYAAAALLRQLVEVEYLSWAFAEDEEEATRWMRSTREERLKLWQPRHIRARAGERFRGLDYALHCEAGGHPTPEGGRLLPDHTTEPDFFSWMDLLFHGLSTWDYSLMAADLLGYGHEIRALPQAKTLAADRELRDEEDPLVPLAAAMQGFLEGRRGSRRITEDDSA